MKKPFNTNARIVKLLGEKNVPNAKSAITELVKNSYDAEGKFGLVLFDCKILQSEDEYNVESIYIIDNGKGMDEDTIDDYWMTIGTDNKEITTVTSDGRALSGAMGIGRLSLDRLGKSTVMYTQKEKASLIRWSVKWDDFNKKQKNVTDIYADLDIEKGMLSDKIDELSKKFPVLEDLFKEYDFDTGTIIKIDNLRDKWPESDIDNLIEYLDMIVPPTDISKFSIFSFKSMAEEIVRATPVVSEDYDYKLIGKASKTGMQITVYRDEFDLDRIDLDVFNEEKMKRFPYDFKTFKEKVYTVDLKYTELIPTNLEKDNNEIFDLVGEFEFEFYFMKQDVTNDEGKYPYKDFNSMNRRMWLKNFSGIKIYRDNFRVRPYGEKNDTANYDWLGLQERARKSPAGPSHPSGSWRVRSNQVAGNLSITRKNNPNIKDMANRQALDENEAFVYMKNILVEIIRFFEKDRQTIMRSISQIQKGKNPDYDLNKQAKEIAKRVVKSSTRKKESNKQQENSKSSLTPEEQTILAKSYSKREQEHEKEKQELVNENQLLRVLATTGITMSSFGHELKYISAILGNRVDVLEGLLQNYISKEDMLLIEDQDENPYVFLQDIQKTDFQIRNWMSITLSNIMRDKRNTRIFDLVKCFRRYVDMWEKIMTDNASNIIFSTALSECKIKAFESDFESILGNLFSNSVEAFKREDASSSRTIFIDLVEENEQIIITYSDTGPGLSKDIKDIDSIFDHLFTTKRDKTGNQIGTGLGMWIVKNIILDYRGKIAIESARSPFQLKMILPRKKGGK